MPTDLSALHSHDRKAFEDAARYHTAWTTAASLKRALAEAQYTDTTDQTQRGLLSLKARYRSTNILSIVLVDRQLTTCRERKQPGSTAPQFERVASVSYASFAADLASAAV